MQSVSVPSGPAVRTTRHHRVDDEFLGLLEEDFQIDAYSLRKAFFGVPKKQAIAVAEWAVYNAGCPEQAGEAIRHWARRRGVGLYDRRLLEAPPVTYGEGV